MSDLKPDSTVSDAWECVMSVTGALRSWDGKLAFAVNGVYSQRTARLEDGDELAIIPPVSGG